MPSPALRPAQQRAGQHRLPRDATDAGIACDHRCPARRRAGLRNASMISAVDIWTFVHILLFVYWLGADLGVFIAAQAAKRSALTYPQRSIALQLALKVDIAPRLSFALMFAWPRTRRRQGLRGTRRVATGAGLGRLDRVGGFRDRHGAL